MSGHGVIDTRSVSLRAERLAAEIPLRRGDVGAALRERLRQAHGIHEVSEDPDQDDKLHRYDPSTRLLRQASLLRPGQQAFRMATQLSHLEHHDLIDQIVAEEAGAQQRPDAGTVPDRAANYFAALILLPALPWTGSVTPGTRILHVTGAREDSSNRQMRRLLRRHHLQQ